VDELLELRTMHVGPDSLIVAAKIALNDDQSADQTEDLADDIDKKLGEKLPMRVQVYIDPTQTRKAEARESPPAPQPSSTQAAAPRTS
jgi:divalent metal cation (Fe/Co/Zn/Cd) transporter